MKKWKKKGGNYTVILLDILASPLAVASPVGDGGATLGVGSGLDGVPHDLDSEDPVGEITVIESEPEIGVGRGSTARVIGGGRIHHHSRVK